MVLSNVFGQQGKPCRLNGVNNAMDHVKQIEEIVKEGEVIVEESEVKNYNRDWTGNYIGKGEMVVVVSSTKELSQLMTYCNENLLAVTPQSGNTGLVGGSVPVHDEIVVSLKRMDNILHYDPLNRIVSVEGGVVLQKLNDYLNRYGVEMPYDLGAKGSCMVGGNISTNAAGKYMIRNNGLRGYVVGLEVVLSDGKVLDMRGAVRKDNTGPDLKQLFIGTEGTLGIITAADIVCVPKLLAKKVILFQMAGFTQVLDVLRQAQNILSSHMVAFEYLDSHAYSILDLLPSLPSPPFPFQSTSYYVLIEVGSSSEEALHDLLLLLSNALSSIVQDSTVSTNQAQYDQLWALRENVVNASLLKGPNLKYDLSLPQEEHDSLVEAVRSRLADHSLEKTVYVLGYGHLADANIHLNVACEDVQVQKRVQNILEPWIFQQIQSFNGSISAEHGLGLMKAQYLHLTKSHHVIQQIQLIKNIFDPKSLLNPYKVYDNSN